MLRDRPTTAPNRQVGRGSVRPAEGTRRAAHGRTTRLVPNGQGRGLRASWLAAVKGGASEYLARSRASPRGAP